MLKMMAKTRFGADIEIKEYLGEGWFLILYPESKETHKWHISEFQFESPEEFHAVAKIMEEKDKASFKKKKRS
jgi:hypothetical protein